jgi:AcrR family transcriptional regulator
MAATPRTRSDAQRNRERIISAASSCFASEGVECQVSEVARHAGLGNATVFRHFPTKLDLVVAVMRRRLDELAAEVEEAAALEDPAEALSGVVEAIGRVLVRDAALKQVAATRFEGDGELLECREHMLAVVDGLVTRCKAAGIVREDFETMDLLLLLSGIAHAASDLEARRPGVWRRYVALVTAAMRPDPSGAPLSPPPPTFEDLDAVGHPKA